MPIARRSSSRADRRPVLIAALSGRALAAAARRARERVIVADLFADRDTLGHAERSLRLPPGRGGFERKALVAAVAALAPQLRGVVYGAGFEHDPVLLGALAALVPVLGNPPSVLAAVKHPLRFAALLARLGLPHPPTMLTAPPARERGWLAKTIGGAGGGHVADAAGFHAAPGVYFQRRVPGRALSALFLANGRGARVLGYSEQWVAAAAAHPFRYGGAAGPVSPPPALARALAAACDRLARAAGLVGLNSLDLLVDGDRFHVIELNPRPGATLDVFDGTAGRSLWRLHLDAVQGKLPSSSQTAGPLARAAAIVYAPCSLTVPHGMAWPDWAADRGVGGSRIAAGAPVCTVRASASAAGVDRGDVGSIAAQRQRGERTACRDAAARRAHAAARRFP
jgi:predicted ATP-grasp superfamily ATP-dependent carboligase